MYNDDLCKVLAQVYVAQLRERITLALLANPNYNPRSGDYNRITLVDEILETILNEYKL
jgi:hypothetical protein